MKIAVMYICTGKYERFWDEFYRTSEELFYPGIEKHYFVFTESKRVMTQKHENVSYVYQARAGWPYDTLLRFHWFSLVQDRIPEFDYCYYCNANSVFLRKVTPELIPLPTEEKPLIFWCHTAHYDDYSSNDITTETNPESTAYIGPNVTCRAYGGGFFGGRSSAFLKMTLTIRDNIQSDLNKGIIAVWHDQSHLVKYATQVQNIDVAKGLVVSEEYADMQTAALIFLNKEKHGGNDDLRDVSFYVRLRHFPQKWYRKLLVVLDKVHMGDVLRDIVKILKSWGAR